MSATDSRFWDRIAARYARDPIADMDAYRRKLEMTRAHLRPDMTLLEIGCGTGGTARAHAPHVARVIATDLSSAMIDIARARGAEAGIDTIDYRVAGLDEVAAPEGGADAVLAMSVLHLVDDRDAALARIHGLLKPGGVFVSSTACLSDGYGWVRYAAPIGRALGKFPSVLRFFTGDALVASVEAAGFRVVERWQPKPKAALFLVAVRD